jgi:hypothetical protein
MGVPAARCSCGALYMHESQGVRASCEVTPCLLEVPCLLQSLGQRWCPRLGPARTRRRNLLARSSAPRELTHASTTLHKCIVTRAKGQQRPSPGPTPCARVGFYDAKPPSCSSGVKNLRTVWSRSKRDGARFEVDEWLQLLDWSRATRWRCRARWSTAFKGGGRYAPSPTSICI